MNQMNEVPLLAVEVGVVFNDQKEVLIAQRLPGASHAGCLEFPGGKREPKEEAYQALARELQEEVGIAITEATHFMTHPYDDGVTRVSLSVWVVTQFVGEPRGCEGQTVFWQTLEDLDSSKFPPGNKAIIDALLKAPVAVGMG